MAYPCYESRKAPHITVIRHSRTSPYGLNRAKVVVRKEKCGARNYNAGVARGWESKSVEAQQAEASEKTANRRPPMSATEAARWRQCENLRLSRQRVLQQLETSANPRHRKQLEESLFDLDKQLNKLGM